jgi:hypothetical protein
MHRAVRCTASYIAVASLLVVWVLLVTGKLHASLAPWAFATVAATWSPLAVGVFAQLEHPRSHRTRHLGVFALTLCIWAASLL